ncbi:hypothetical protein T439DRAFT_358317 [Meredithblackwellia eburnea MCA 4105]
MSRQTPRTLFIVNNLPSSNLISIPLCPSISTDKGERCSLLKKPSGSKSTSHCRSQDGRGGSDRSLEVVEKAVRFAPTEADFGESVLSTSLFTFLLIVLGFLTPQLPFNFGPSLKTPTQMTSAPRPHPLLTLNLAPIFSHLYQATGIETTVYRSLTVKRVADPFNDAGIKQLHTEYLVYKVLEENESIFEKMFVDHPLEVLHSLGITHHDLHPGNIIISFDEVSGNLDPVIIDFGASSLPGCPTTRVGVPAYKDTGHWQRDQPSRPMADMQSFGHLLYFILHNHHPFDVGEADLDHHTWYTYGVFPNLNIYFPHFLRKFLNLCWSGSFSNVKRMQLKLTEAIEECSDNHNPFFGPPWPHPTSAEYEGQLQSKRQSDPRMPLPPSPNLISGENTVAPAPRPSRLPSLPLSAVGPDEGVANETPAAKQDHSRPLRRESRRISQLAGTVLAQGELYRVATGSEEVKVLKDMNVKPKEEEVEDEVGSLEDLYKPEVGGDGDRQYKDSGSSLMDEGDRDQKLSLRWEIPKIHEMELQHAGESWNCGLMFDDPLRKHRRRRMRRLRRRWIEAEVDSVGKCGEEVIQNEIEGTGSRSKNGYDELMVSREKDINQVNSRAPRPTIGCDAQVVRVVEYGNRCVMNATL